MPLLEREPDLELLNSVLDRTREGSGRVVLVAGEAGIGKTSLLQEFVAKHQHKVRVLWGGCEALFTPHPLAPLYDIARQAGGDFTAALSAATSRHDIFNITLERLGSMTGPTVMIIEDAHWADEATLDLIKFLGRRLQRLGVMLVMTYRDDTVYDKHPLCSVIGDFPPASVHRILLSPLSASAVGLLAQASGRAPADLHTVTGGNPFFVTEVLATSGSHMPPTVRDAVIARMARLSDAAREVAYLVSIVPGKAERWLVDSAVSPGNEALQECLNAGMVMSPDYGLRFRHELARRAVEDNIPATQRQELNAIALASLLSQGENKVAIARLVHHADRAADSEAVLRFAPLAAERASAVGAHREAAFYLETALRHGAALDGTERARFLERRSYECYLIDRIEDSIESRQAALALWRAAGARLQEGDNLRWLSRLAWFNGQRAEAERYAVEAVETLEPLPPGRELAMAYSNRSQLHMLAYEPAQALEWGQKALDLATSLGDIAIQTHALNNIGTTKYMQLDPQGLHDLERALKMALDAGLDEHVARAYVNICSMDVRHRNHSPAALARLQEGLDYCDARDLDSWSGYLQAHRGEARLALGRWDDAGRDADAIARCAASAPIIKIPALTTLGRLRARRGDPDMETPLAQAYRFAIPADELQRLVPAVAARAEAAWIHGQSTEEILQLLADAYEFCLRRGGGDPWLTGELAFWLWRHGRLTETPAGLPEPYALQITGDWEGAARAWENLGCTYDQAVALSDSDEEKPLRTALEIFERLGAGPLAATVRRKLRASGVRSIRRGAQESTRQNPAGMTNQEIKVLALLAEGRRNADIARQLFVSEKTVGHHVSSVLAKLGVHSRGEAAAAAARLGLAPSRLESQAANK